MLQITCKEKREKKMEKKKIYIYWKKSIGYNASDHQILVRGDVHLSKHETQTQTRPKKTKSKIQ